MSAVTELIDALISRGMTPAEAATLVARAGAEMNAVGPSKGAVRTRRWRENRASQSVTERHTVTLDQMRHKASQSVTERHQTSHVTDAHIDTSSSTKEETINKKRKKTISAFFDVPDDASEENRTFAAGKGWNRQRIDGEWQRFHDHSINKGKKHRDVAAAWRSWVTSPYQTNGPQNGRQDDRKSLLAAFDRQIEQFGGMEAANAYVPGSSGPTPLRLDLSPLPTSRKFISSR